MQSTATTKFERTNITWAAGAVKIAWSNPKKFRANLASDGSPNSVSDEARY